MGSKILPVQIATVCHIDPMLLQTEINSPTWLYDFRANIAYVRILYFRFWVMQLESDCLKSRHEVASDSIEDDTTQRFVKCLATKKQAVFVSKNYSLISTSGTYEIGNEES